MWRDNSNGNMKNEEGTRELQVIAPSSSTSAVIQSRKSPTMTFLSDLGGLKRLVRGGGADQKGNGRQVGMRTRVLEGRSLPVL